jgi:nitrite reductase/ring-hydroxylating ferredoxin subunit
MISNQAKKHAQRKLIGEVGELSPGRSKKFTFNHGKHSLEAVLLNYQGNLYAYVNRCPHVGLSLDWMENQFFTIDGRYLLCANHGATFAPATGECIWGPCVGAALQSVRLEMEGEKIFVQYLREKDQEESSEAQSKRIVDE